MTRMSYRFYLILLIVMGMGACKKDAPVPPPSGGCNSWLQLPFTQFSHDRFQFGAPFFNPQNPKEFAFQYMDIEKGEFELRTYNMETKDNMLLAENIKIISKPRWNMNGWIATDNVFDYQIRIVKSNGDSLKKITADVFNYHPVWNISGESIYYRFTPTMGVPYYFLKKELENLSQTDTILRYDDPFQGFAGTPDVSIDNTLISRTFIDNRYSIGIGDLENLYFTQVIDMYKTFEIDFPTDLAWNHDGTKVFISIYDNGTDEINGLFEIDVASGSITKFLDYCWDQQYSKISASPNGEHLIGERVDSYYRVDENGNPTGNIARNSRLFLIDIKTGEETLIEID